MSSIEETNIISVDMNTTSFRVDLSEPGDPSPSVVGRLLNDIRGVTAMTGSDSCDVTVDLSDTDREATMEAILATIREATPPDLVSR